MSNVVPLVTLTKPTHSQLGQPIYGLDGQRTRPVIDEKEVAEDVTPSPFASLDHVLQQRYRRKKHWLLARTSPDRSVVLDTALDGPVVAEKIHVAVECHTSDVSTDEPTHGCNGAVELFDVRFLIHSAGENNDAHGLCSFVRRGLFGACEQKAV
jgi:hypothetical protein